MAGAGDAEFDFAAFKRAYEAKDADRQIGFYADDAEWIEYRNQDPPHRPNRMIGRQAIEDFLRRVTALPITVTIEDEIVTKDRVAFRVWVGLSDGRRIVEHAMLYLRDGRIARQVEVEAWD